MSAVLPFPSAPSSALIERLEDEPGAALDLMTRHCEAARKAVKDALRTPSTIHRFTNTHLHPLLVDLASFMSGMQCPSLRDDSRSERMREYYYGAKHDDRRAARIIQCIPPMGAPQHTRYLNSPIQAAAGQYALSCLEHIESAVACLVQLQRLTEKEEESNGNQ